MDFIKIKLQEFRLRRGYSLRKLATKVGVTASFLSQIENGKTTPSIATLSKIASVLGVDSADFFQGDKQNSHKMCKGSLSDKQALFSISILNSMEYLSVLSQFLKEVCNVRKIDRETIYELLIASDEAATNIINYAYPREGVCNFRVELRFYSDSVSICFIDQGKPFDPTKMQSKPIKEGEDDAYQSELGLYMLKKLMNRVEYKTTEQGENILTITKQLKVKKS